MKNDFNEFRFAGLGYKKISNKYLTMKRYNEGKNKIVVKVAPEHLITTKFGYGLKLNKKNLIWLKEWQVSNNWYGIEVLLIEEYFKPVKAVLDFEELGEDEENLKFDTWLKAAIDQENFHLIEDDNDVYNKVKWEI